MQSWFEGVRLEKFNAWRGDVERGEKSGFDLARR